ncbi:MAG: 4Fe-4S binding protein [Firmicutes bacterium]|nr:4Fe-4S binding protein [Bacillota bacterium]
MDAITLKKGEAWIVDAKKCDQCGRCARVCTFGALEMPIGPNLFSRGMAESTKAVLSTFAPGKVLYVNFVMEVQPECDCMPTADTPLVQDQGILISDDIVAIETATLDLLDKATPLPQSKAADKDITTPGDLFLRVNGQDPRLAVGYAEELGLGKSSYELVEIKKKRKSKASN